MKTGLHIILPLLLLSFLMGSTLFPEKPSSENHHSFDTQKPHCCSDGSSDKKACPMQSAQSKHPGKSGCSENEKDCPGCIVTHIAPFTIPDFPGLVRIEIFQGTPGTFKQNIYNHIEQPPVPPPVTYC